tara:strand:- start:2203 stop:2643 length:441 start_codon:yes stop_codon:yes gene_type:complete
MSVKNKYISFLEQLLIHLKNAKLEYLRAGDVASRIEDKRYFNQQALLRNRFFHEVLSQLQNENINLKDLVVRNFNFDQLLISSIRGLKNSASEKCLEADSHLKELYQNIMLLPLDSSLFEKQFERIESAIAYHETLHTSFNFATDN